MTNANPTPRNWRDCTAEEILDDVRALVAEMVGPIIVDVGEDITIDPRPGRELWTGLYTNADDLRRRNDVRPGVVTPADDRPLPEGTMTRQQRRAAERALVKRSGRNDGERRR